MITRARIIARNIDLAASAEAVFLFGPFGGGEVVDGVVFQVTAATFSGTLLVSVSRCPSGVSTVVGVEGQGARYSIGARVTCSPPVWVPIGCVFATDGAPFLGVGVVEGAGFGFTGSLWIQMRPSSRDDSSPSRIGVGGRVSSNVRILG